jgi:uncharacterized protein (TIGR02246 family)
MNTSFLSPVAFAAWILLAAASPAPAKGMPPVDPFVSAVSPAAVEQEVRRMFEDYFKTVERHELKNFLAFFAEDEDLTVLEDKEMYDWKGFVAFAEGFFQQVAEIKFDHEKCTVNPIGPGVAVATGVFRAAGKTTSGEPISIRNSYTFVLLKQGVRWRIKHVHESSL